MGSFLTHALNENKKLVKIDDVATGKVCSCTCPNCGEPLVAKNKGKIKEHHFAHANGKTCEGAYETALHLLAKEILIEKKCLMLPQNTDKHPKGLVRFSSIQSEKWDPGLNIKPDVEGITENGERILIEFLVTHKVNDAKRKVILNNNLHCIEINLNYQELDKENLYSFLTNSEEDRSWIGIEKEQQRGQTKREWTILHQKDPIVTDIKEYLKDLFVSQKLNIRPFSHSPYFSKYDQHFNLNALSYDSVEIDAKFRGLQTHLLLYRSSKKDKGHIAITIRKRKRSANRKIPKGLRIIDIIVDSSSKKCIQYVFPNDTIINGYSTEFYGFKYPLSSHAS